MVTTKLTRKTVMRLPDRDKWLESEAAQLNKYQLQGMFSEPCPLPKQTDQAEPIVALPFAWTHMYKEGEPKARGARQTYQKDQTH